MRRLAVVVDLQRGFVPDGSSVPGRVERLLDGHDGPVGLTRFVNAPDSPTRALGYDALPPGDPAGELHPVAARARDGGASTFEKSGYSAFDAPGFAAFVERVDPDRTLVCGLETDACVLATAFALFDRGRRPAVVADACATGGDHDAALRVARRSLGDEGVTTVGAVG